MCKSLTYFKNTLFFLCYFILYPVDRYILGFQPCLACHLIKSFFSHVYFQIWEEKQINFEIEICINTFLLIQSKLFISFSWFRKIRTLHLKWNEKIRCLLQVRDRIQKIPNDHLKHPPTPIPSPYTFSATT